MLLYPFISVVALPLPDNAKVENKAVRDAASLITIENTKKFINPSEQFPMYYSETVRNQSSGKPAFVTVEVYKLNNPGGEKEDLTKLSLVEEAGIYAMPNKLVIPAGGSRAVRVYLTKEIARDKDQYYRIRFSPSPVIDEEVDKKNKSKNAPGLSLGIGFGQLLMINREKPVFETRVYTRKKGQDEILEIENKGNSFIRLDKMKVCFIKELKEPCQYLGGKHINAGSQFFKELIKTIRSVDFTLIEGTRHRKVQYDRAAKKPLSIQ